MEKILDDIIKKIKAKLKENGMNQEEFSKLMGKNKNWLTALLHVQNDIKVKDLVRACQILKVEPSYLLSGNFSHNICEMSIEELVKMLVKKECEEYFNKNKKAVSNLLNCIRGSDVK